jgi:hypothetical protein
MTVSDAMRAVLAIFPNAEVGSDNDGQLVIYTGCRVNEEWELVPFAAEEV